MARSPRGRCITCDKYTTLMYVDQCRTCFEFEESIEKGTTDQEATRPKAPGVKE